MAHVGRFKPSAKGGLHRSRVSRQLYLQALWGRVTQDQIQVDNLSSDLGEYLFLCMLCDGAS